MNRRGGGEDEEEGAEGDEHLPLLSNLSSPSSNLFLPSRVVSFKLILLSFFL